jgi:hypothetical protein
MKNRKIAVTAILLVALLCVGVGYAALTDTITATGTVNINVSGFDLQWASDDTSAITTTASDNTLTFTIPAGSLVNEGDSVVIKAKVKNASTASYSAKITGVTVNNSATYGAFYSVDFTGIAANDVIAKGASKDVTFTVTLDKMPLENIANDTFTVVVSAESVLP